MNKMHETLDVVQLMGLWTCVEHTVAWLRGGTQQADGQAEKFPVKKAISVALDSALMISEALVDRVLPPTDEDKEEEAHWMEGFEAILGRSFPLRLVSFCQDLKVGAKMQYFQVIYLSRRICLQLFQDLQTKCLRFAWSIRMLPQHQPLSVFISQMYNFGSSAHQPNIKSDQDRCFLNATETSTHMGIVPLSPQVETARRLRSLRSHDYNNRCNAEGCLR